MKLGTQREQRQGMAECIDRGTARERTNDNL